MPYCVNCGVELSGSEEKCPLCGTEVYRPKSAAKGGSPDALPYPPYKPLTIQRVSKSSIIILITLLSLLPVLLTLICDLSINRGVTWSAYAAASVAFLYLCIVLPLPGKKRRPVFCLTVDACAMIFLLLFIERKSGGSWFLPFALPLALYVSAVLIVLTLLGCRHIVSPMKITALSFLFAGIGTLLIELLLNRAFALRDRLIWSYYPLTVLVLIGVVLFYIDCNKPLKERLARKFFI